MSHLKKSFLMGAVAAAALCASAFFSILAVHAACTNPSTIPPGFSTPCPVFSLSSTTVTQSQTLTLSATPQPGTDYIYTTAYISQGTAWNPYTLQGNNAYPAYSSALASLTLSSTQLQSLSLGTHYAVVWDWLWDATANCYKGPGLNQCNTGQWRVQSFSLTSSATPTPTPTASPYTYSQSSYYAYSQSAYVTPTNLALGKIPTASATFAGNPALITDNDLNTANWVEVGTGAQWIKIDLGAAYSLNDIKVWHYYGDGRTYHDVIVQVSSDATFTSGVTTLFNNDTNNSAGQGTGTNAEYTETSLGKDLPFSSVNARYVRLWTNGNTVNAYNHYVEVQIFGSAGSYTYSQSAYYAYSQSAYYAYSQSSYYAYSQAAYTVGNAIPATLFGSTFLGISNYTNNASNIPIGNLGKEIGGYWTYVEPNAPVGSGCPGTTNCTHTYNWSTLDSYVAAAQAHGLFFQWTQDLAPSWATNNVGCANVSGNGVIQCSGPITDTVDFGAFIDALVTRYNVGSSHGTINAYETGNEQDYIGTAAQMAAQIKEFVAHIKAINLSALIVGIGAEGSDTWYEQVSTPCSGQYFDCIWAAWKAIDSNAHFDALTFHGYPHTGGVTNPGTPEVVIGGPGTVDTTACPYGYAKCIQMAISRDNVTTFAGGTPQLWDTESDWGATPGGGTTPDAFIGRFMLLNWAAGVSHQEWFFYDGSGSTGQILGYPDRVTAYQQVHDWMVGSTMNQNCALISGSTIVWTCGLKNSAGVQTQAVWNTSGSSSYTVPSGYAHYKDLAGNTTAISGSTVTIGIQPILLVP